MYYMVYLQANLKFMKAIGQFKHSWWYLGKLISFADETCQTTFRPTYDTTCIKSEDNSSNRCDNPVQLDCKSHFSEDRNKLCICPSRKKYADPLALVIETHYQKVDISKMIRWGGDHYGDLGSNYKEIVWPPTFSICDPVLAGHIMEIIWSIPNQTGKFWEEAYIQAISQWIYTVVPESLDTPCFNGNYNP